jgi:hypothetical protein
VLQPMRQRPPGGATDELTGPPQRTAANRGRDDSSLISYRAWEVARRSNPFSPNPGPEVATRTWGNGVTSYDREQP